MKSIFVIYTGGSVPPPPLLLALARSLRSLVYTGGCVPPPPLLLALARSLRSLVCTGGCVPPPPLLLAHARSLIIYTALLALGFGGCARYEYRTPATAPGPQPLEIASPSRYETQKPTETGKERGLEDICKTDPAACPKLDLQTEAATPPKEEIYAVQQTTTLRAGEAEITKLEPPPAPPPPEPVQVGSRPAKEMIDVEARVELEVDNIEKSVSRIRSLVARTGGQVVNEVIEHKPSSSGAALSLRVPTSQAERVLAELAKVGKLSSRKVESRDVGREYHDAEILLRNLELTLRRYEELLSKAQGTPQVLQIERELARVRTELDRVKGDMRWLRDRATRATIYVTLTAVSAGSELVEPTAKLYPGLRAASLIDVSKRDGSRTFLGGGLSVMFGRVFSVDADWMTRARNGDGIELFITTAGTELYSDLLGGGSRRFFNPYLGFRLGYARLLGDGAFAAGGVLGVELYKTDIIMIDLQARAYALFGVEDSTHAAFEPALGVNFAY